MKKRLALCSAFSQTELSVSALFMHEILGKLEQYFEVVKFSEEQDKIPIHNLFMVDQKNPFHYSLTFSEDRSGCLNYRFFPISVPGVQVLVDANFDRLYFEFPWHFQDLSKVSLLRQIVDGSTAVAGMNEHALSNVRSLNLFDEQSLFGLQIPVSKVSSDEERLIQEHQQSNQFHIGYAARYFNEEKSHEVIDCLLELASDESNVRLVWLTRKSEIPNIKHFLQTESDRRQVDIAKLVEILPVESFIDERAALCRVNVFLSLRKDFLHSPPSAFYHSLALGIPTIASEMGPMTGVSRESALFVPAGRGEAAGILAALNAVRTNEDLRVALSRESRAYTDLVHNPELVASDIVSILEYSGRQKPQALDNARRRRVELEARL